jgi:hypothetical protein
MQMMEEFEDEVLLRDEMECDLQKEEVNGFDDLPNIEENHMCKVAKEEIEDEVDPKT